MFNKLYSKVFGISQSGFNANNNYYTVLFNFAQDAGYSESLSTEASLYIPKNCYSEYKSAAADAVDFIAQTIDARRDSPVFNVDTCYTLLFDYTDKDISSTVAKATGKLLELGAVKSNDIPVVILTLPDDDSKVVAYMESLEKQEFSDKVKLYLVQKKRQNNIIADSVCGILVLNNYKSVTEKLRSNYYDTDRFAKTTIESFPAEGQNMLNAKKPLMWSTVLAAYSDDKMDYLRYYMFKLCNNAEAFTKYKLKEICDEYSYKRTNAVGQSLIERLEYAINSIPFVTNKYKINDTDALSNRFAMCYGYDGERVVDLTLKVNLADVQRYTDVMVTDAAENLFKLAKAYHSDDLLGEVKRNLKEYINELNTEILEKREYMRSYLRDAGTVRQYVERYIAYDNEQKKQEFWERVYTYIENNSAFFSEACAYSGNLSAKLATLKTELSYAHEVNLDIDTFPEYPAEILLDAPSDESICDNIKNSYEHYIDIHGVDRVAKQNSVVSTFADMFTNTQGLFKDYEYNITAMGTFTSIKQRIGKYYLFGK